MAYKKLLKEHKIKYLKTFYCFFVKKIKKEEQLSNQIVNINDEIVKKRK